MAAEVTEQAHRILTSAEVALIFRVDPKTVTRWALEGALHSFRTPGRHHRFWAADVQALLKKNSTPAVPGEKELTVTDRTTAQP